MSSRLGMSSSESWSSISIQFSSSSAGRESVPPPSADEIGLRSTSMSAPALGMKTSSSGSRPTM
eukprot:3236282-Lingulodinium_polyedra.AAC.1